MFYPCISSLPIQSQSCIQNTYPNFYNPSLQWSCQNSHTSMPLANLPIQTYPNIYHTQMCSSSGVLPLKRQHGNIEINNHIFQKQNITADDLDNIGTLEQIFNDYLSMRDLGQTKKQTEEQFQNVQTVREFASLNENMFEEKLRNFSPQPQAILSEIYRKCKEVLYRYDVLLSPTFPKYVFCPGRRDFDIMRKILESHGFAHGEYEKINSRLMSHDNMLTIRSLAEVDRSVIDSVSDMDTDAKNILLEIKEKCKLEDAKQDLRLKEQILTAKLHEFRINQG